MVAQRILILEPDRSFAERLEAALGRIKTFVVTRVATVDEARRCLGENRQDVALLPVTDSMQMIRSLRAIQPDLRVILMTPTTDVQVPMVFLGQVQGVLIKSLMAFELPTVLAAAVKQPFLAAGGQQVTSVPLGIRLPDSALVLGILQQAKLGRLVQSVVFSQGSQLMAHWGELTEAEAATVALRAAEAGTEGARPTRIQFLYLPARAGDLLLYSCPIAEDYLLTLVALPETPVNELRSRSEKLQAPLAKVVKGRATSMAQLQTGPLHGRTSYAIIWRPVRPLPAGLHIPLRRALERLAATNACVLTHTEVRPELIHVVVTCPPGRDSGWAAYLFKNGSEQIIQEQFGVAATLWDKGFHAVESADPLSAAELNIFLERDA